jgi:hypothetical protein
MKNLLVLSLVFGAVLLSVEVVPAQKVRLRSRIAPGCATTSSLKYADIYAEGDVAVQGSYNCRGAFIYNINNPDVPVLANWYNPGANQQFLEAIVLNGRGYFGSGNGGGVHVVDLSQPNNPVLLGIVNSTNGNAHNSIHEMVVFEQNGATILVENFNSLTGNKTLKFINVTNPASAVWIRDLTPTEPQWVHAMHVRGNRMFTSGWGNSTNRGRTEIYDISNIAAQAPTLLGFISDQTSITAGNSMHSSWSSEDGNYLYSCRETSTGSGDLRVYDISNPAVPLLVRKITMNDLGLNAVTPHNPVVVGNYLYIAWYQAGIQVFDISTPSNPVRVGQYDTYQTQFAPSAEELKLLEAADPWDIMCGGQNLQNSLPTTYDGNWAVYPLLGQNKILAGDLTNGLLVLDASEIGMTLRNKVADFDGDRKTDFSVFSPSTGVWQTERSSTGQITFTPWGEATDKILSGDYDGDGSTDLAVFRPSSGTWYIWSSGAGIIVTTFGQNGDVPVPADYDADGKTDVAVWRPSNGTWYIRQSTLGYRIQTWGVNGDKALAGDFEGDGKADMAIWRPSTGFWYIIQSSSSIPSVTVWGQNGDKPLLADFDGDGRADVSLYRPSTGNWYIKNSRDNSFAVYLFGIEEDVPVPADYDGDGRSDVAVFRPSTDTWYRLNSSDGGFVARVFGAVGDTPTPASAQPQ